MSSKKDQAERLKYIKTLRNAGYTFKEIGARLGLQGKTIQKIYHKAMIRV